MANELNCRGCQRPLPDHHATFVGNLEYNLWAREGFCSFFCFRENASADLIRRDEEIESQRQEWLFSIHGSSPPPDELRQSQ